MAEAYLRRGQRGYDVGAVNQPVRLVAERLVIPLGECRSAHPRHAIRVNRVCLYAQLSERALRSKYCKGPAKAVAGKDEVLRPMFRPKCLTNILPSSV